ncbi:hypothetical protein ES703_96344 [subsurface metagenome]
MGVDDLDDGHRAQQEEGDARRRRNALVEFMPETGIIADRKGIDRPQQSGAKEGGSRLADLKRVFESYGGIGRNEDEDQRDNQGNLEQTAMKQSYAPGQ